MGTADDTAPFENMNQAVFKIEGMTCEGCATILAQAIKTAPRVLAVQVDYEAGQAVVGTKICCPVPEEEILSVIEQAGFKVKQIVAETPSE